MIILASGVKIFSKGWELVIWPSLIDGSMNDTLVPLKNAVLGIALFQQS